MNYIRTKVNTVSVFFGLLFFIIFSVHAERPINIKELGTPIVQKFPFPNFSLLSGKFSVYEDPYGVFLIGAQDKMIVFYGNEFVPIKLEGQINISSNQKSVFYTGYNSLGIIKLYKNSLPQLLPLVDEKRNKGRFGQINNVYISGDLTVFNNDKKLFVFNDSEFLVVDSSKVKIQLFRTNDSIFVNKFEKGLFKFSNGKLIPIFYGEKLTGRIIQQILLFNGSILIKCSDNEHFLKLDNSGLNPIVFGFEDFVLKAGFADALVLTDNTLAIGTKSAGIILFNPKTKIIKYLGTNDGLLDNSVKNLHLDKAGNLWVLHEVGISRIELNIPATICSASAGVSGKINDILRYNGRIYLATSNGLYKESVSNNNEGIYTNQPSFIQVEGIVNKVFKLFVDNKNLFIVTPTGIYKLKGEKTVQVYNGEINCIAQLSREEYVIGLEMGLKFLKYSGESFTEEKNDPINHENIVEVVEDFGNTLWLKTSKDKIIRYNIKLGLKNESKYLCLNLQVPERSNNFHLLKTSKGIRFCYPDSILFYNSNTNKFQLDEVLDLKHLNGIPWLVESQSDKFGNRWFYVSSSIKDLEGVLLYKKSPDKPVFFNTGTSISPVYFDSSTVWIGGDNKLIKFDNTKHFNFPRVFSAIIKRVIINSDSVLNIKLEDPEIKFWYNNLKFEVSSTGFEGEPYVRYQYKLDGKDKKWSNWTLNGEINYTHLSPGSYTFKVRALNIDGMVSGDTELKFYILHPFYLTIPAYIVYFILLLFIAFVMLRWRTWAFMKDKEKVDRIVHERTEDILREKEKSEILIANMLPKGTADELKLTGKVLSQKFSMATVLFSDIQGFTKIAEQMNPEMLIDQLDAFFFHFDMVVEKYNIEKIKTIGDAYMCAGGIPNKNITNPIEVVLAALEMQEYMHELQLKNADIWDLRIGIHTGSVIAGVVGHKKLSYDIWGDTVNTASRMESSGEAGKVNISGHTYDLVKDFFICEHRGKMPVKYKGEIDMYFVKSIRPELAVDMKHNPNQKFFVKLQLIRLQDLEDEIIEKLTHELPKNLYFHNISRIKDVYGLVELYSRAEGLTEEENLIIRTAAILHDIGYIWDYNNPEDESIKYARENLPNYKYTQGQIEKIVDLIEATKRLRKPQNRMEEILLDADMNYLSRADFVTLNLMFFNELKERNKTSSWEDWMQRQIVLLSNHKYYTNVANVLRDVNSEQQIENIVAASKKTGQ